MFGWIMGACGMVDPSGFRIMNANLVGGYKDGRTSFFMNWFVSRVKILDTWRPTLTFCLVTATRPKRP